MQDSNSKFLNDDTYDLNDDIYNYGTVERVNKLRAVLEKRQKSITVVMENIADSHNVSACLRSCDAVGILDVCFVYHSGQSFPVLGEASSASAKKWLGKRKFTTIEECYNTLRTEGKKIYTTHLSQNSVSLYDLDLTQNIALVFGNEHSGVSDNAVEMADDNFLVPQIGVIQSLNISVACAVSVFEAMRQRQLKGMLENSELSEKEIMSILKEWLLK
jgi:tRNA (guanosine-2'-O-)-methyltransferase